MEDIDTMVGELNDDDLITLLKVLDCKDGTEAEIYFNRKNAVSPNCKASSIPYGADAGNQPATANDGGEE